MRVENIVFLLEERSAKHMIDAIIPKLLPQGVSHYSYSFEGKSDLEKKHYDKNEKLVKTKYGFSYFTRSR